MNIQIALCALLLAGCPDANQCAPVAAPPNPCGSTVVSGGWPEYGADPVVGACWRKVDRGALEVPCARVLAMPDFAAVRDCPAFRADGGTR